jgi:hypothetical protein
MRQHQPVTPPPTRVRLVENTRIRKQRIYVRFSAQIENSKVSENITGK